MSQAYEPVDTEHFLTRLLGTRSTHGLATGLLEDGVWRRYLGRALSHLPRYVEANVAFTDVVHRETIERLSLGLLEASKMKPSLLREQALVAGLVDMVLCLIGDQPNHWERSWVGHPKHYRLNKHRSVGYTQSVEQRARLIADQCSKWPRPGGLSDSEAKDVRERYWASIHPRPNPAAFVTWFRAQHPAAYLELFS